MALEQVALGTGPDTPGADTLYVAFTKLNSNTTEIGRGQMVAASMPSSGAYAAGEFVRNSGATVDGNGAVLFGWHRLTTGSGHTLGVDWVGLYLQTETFSAAGTGGDSVTYMAADYVAAGYVV